MFARFCVSTECGEDSGKLSVVTVKSVVIRIGAFKGLSIFGHGFLKPPFMRTTGGSGSNVLSAAGRSEPPPPSVPGGSATAAGEVGGGGLNVRGLPLAKPPYGRITAIDMDQGEIAWQIAHGETADNLRNHPALKGLNIQRTGRAGQIGTLVTRTLVIAGDAGVSTQPSGARGAMLRAYEKATGREVGSVFMRWRR